MPVDDPIVEAAIDQRRKFFEAKRDHLYQIEIFYCILLEGVRSKTGVGTALARLLRDSKGAIAELKSQFTNDSMKALLHTHIDRDLQRLSFDHPARKLLLDCFPMSTGAFRNVVLTGTAGEGKTSLCFELVKELTGSRAKGTSGVEEICLNTTAGPRKITLIYDVTAWRTKTDGHISNEDVALLERMAESSFGTSEEFFVLAVNDGQMHELFRALPSNAPESLRKLEKNLIGLHARNESDCGNRLRLVNLSMVPSEQIMGLCLTAILDRPEWVCFQEENENPLFSESSSLSRITER